MLLFSKTGPYDGSYLDLSVPDFGNFFDYGASCNELTLLLVDFFRWRILSPSQKYSKPTETPDLENRFLAVLTGN